MMYPTLPNEKASSVNRPAFTGRQARDAALCGRTGTGTSDCHSDASRPAKGGQCDGLPPQESADLPSGTAHIKDAPQHSGRGFVSKPYHTSCYCQQAAGTGCTQPAQPSGVPHSKVHRRAGHSPGNGTGRCGFLGNLITSSLYFVRYFLNILEFRSICIDFPIQIAYN